MYKVIKQTINSRKDVIATVIVAYIDCDKDTFMSRLVPMYHNIAVLTNNSYKIHGLSQKIKFIVEEVKVQSNIDTIVSDIINTIKRDADELNKYIEYLNRAIRVSNNRNFRIINEGVIEPVNFHDYLFKDIEIVAYVKDNVLIIE